MRYSFSSSSLHIMMFGPSMSLHDQAVRYLAQPSSLATSSATSALVIDARALRAAGAKRVGAALPTLKALLEDDGKGLGGRVKGLETPNVALLKKPVPLAEPGAPNGEAAPELEPEPNEKDGAEDDGALAPNEKDGAEDDGALAAEELTATGVPNGPAAALPNPDALVALDAEAKGVPMGEPKTAWGDMAAREPEFGTAPNPPAVRARRMASSNNRMDTLTEETPTLDAAQFSSASLHLSAVV